MTSRYWPRTWFTMSRSCKTIWSNTLGASLSSMNSAVSDFSDFFVDACLTPFSISVSK
jgi:hypothetical protein